MKELLFNNGVELPPHLTQALKGEYEFGVNFFHLKTKYTLFQTQTIALEIGEFLVDQLGREVSVIVGVEGKKDFYKAFKPKISYYVRCLSYDEALKAVEKMRELGGYANINMGGIYVEGDLDKIQLLLEFMENNFRTFELCGEPASKINSKIIKQLKIKENKNG